MAILLAQSAIVLMVYYSVRAPSVAAMNPDAGDRRLGVAQLPFVGSWLLLHVSCTSA